MILGDEKSCRGRELEAGRGGGGGGFRSRHLPVVSTIPESASENEIRFELGGKVI